MKLLKEIYGIKITEVKGSATNCSAPAPTYQTGSGSIQILIFGSVIPSLKLITGILVRVVVGKLKFQRTGIF